MKTAEKEKIYPSRASLRVSIIVRRNKSKFDLGQKLIIKLRLIEVDKKTTNNLKEILLGMKKNTIGQEFKFGDIETTNKIYDNIEDKSIGGLKGIKNLLPILKVPGNYFNKSFFPACFFENSAAELKAIFNDLRHKRKERFSGKFSESF